MFFKPQKKKKSDIGADAKAHQLKSLLEVRPPRVLPRVNAHLIGSKRLMNLSVTSPGDPWIFVSSSASPDDATEDDEDEDERRLTVSQALVDWVVGAGIAVQHPNDARRVKLVEFGRQIGAERDDPL